MLAYHPDSAANQVPDILDGECRGVVRGIELVPAIRGA
jgi:hypothetical protein